MKPILILLSLTLIFGCSSSNNIIESQTKKAETPNIYHCQVIHKQFQSKGGKMISISELYLRCSVQDYFIKICESNYTKAELMKYVNTGISAEIEIRDGLWDNCSSNLAEVQSRTGSYIIIKSIKE